MRLPITSERGFSITEMLMTVAVASTLMAVAVPVTRDLTATAKLNEAARLVEREFQDARLRAVSANRVLRVRTNCPAEGFVRTVEVLGTSVDSASNRCLQSAYPFPPDDNLMTRPNSDGPVRTLPNSATVTTANYDFWPDGTVQVVVGSVSQPMAGEETLTITRQGRSRTLRINGAGKVSLQ
jgi:prepilin-type N-terminal cleavage/methylation domain-containing protein